MLYLLFKFCSNSRNKIPSVHNTNIYLIKYIHFKNILVQCCLYKYTVVYNFALFLLYPLLKRNCSILFLSCHNYSFTPEVFWWKISAFFGGSALLVWDPTVCCELMPESPVLSEAEARSAMTLIFAHPNMTNEDQRDYFSSTYLWQFL